MNRDADELARAVKLFEGSSRKIALALALADHAAAIAHHDVRAGVRQLDRALEIFSAAGASHDARRVRQRVPNLT
jgi:hypothetical protein